MSDVCNETLQTFVAERLEGEDGKEGAKNATIDRSLEVVRTVMNRAARVWRDDGKPWLPSSPLTEMLDETQQRRPPYPITWAQQATLLPALARHLQLQLPVLFALNTGARDTNVCGLRWSRSPAVDSMKSMFLCIDARGLNTSTGRQRLNTGALIP